MKKVRALSLILTALLTVANLPLSVNAAAEVTTTAVENFPAEATVSYTDGVTVTNKDEVKVGDVTNGYITVDRRLWWRRIQGATGHGLNQELLAFTMNLTLMKPKYITFLLKFAIM